MNSIFETVTYSAPGSASPFDYSIELQGGDTIFRGRAYAAPNEDIVRIRINQIAQDWLFTNIPNLDAADITTTTTVHPDACRTFILKDSGGTPISSYQFLLDWSYQPKDFSSTVVLSDPVDGRYANGMFLFRTSVTSGGVVSTVAGHSGVAGYNSLECDESGYAVYYLNRSGGFDSYLIRGKVVESDGYTRYDIHRHYTVGSLDFGRKTYNNQIVKSFDMNSGYLTDSQARNLSFNLISSNQVYLHDLRNDIVYPVCVTNSETEYKTFKNNRRMANIAFTVELSHTYQNIN